ncbi:uncharacterized protein BP5553_07888 [Venustampulla echinocandica]|uniref:Carboxypeptidase n=1 Tax=Venustampulla echinocandica TaxID=2656787 RepID=A0A370THU8_9HELO|nr:uncharacterized protein BP5553_07888 [Venustampulla echinocandica]RDL34760.1 hypothetical protein BP5553_07888 [Venustampulla echinocandica]
MMPQLNHILACLALLILTLTSQGHGLIPDPKRDNRPEMRGKSSIVKRDGVDHNIFEHEATGAKLDFVKNSGICETTPGVNQYSGYVSVGKNQSMWFWFFEARHNPHKAPLALWLNGGPGCSSMIGLFQELGPCTFKGNSTTPSLNPHSWNEYANMLFVDEPIGAGFSYGSQSVNTSVAAAPFVWNLMQAFFANFEQYKNREFGLFTESYGGHYGPGSPPTLSPTQSPLRVHPNKLTEFASYFESQNNAISNGDVTGQPINLVALGINNGWYDAYIQEIEFINFSLSNTYKPLINSSLAAQYKAEITAGCLPVLKNCTTISGLDAECFAAHEACGTIDNKYSDYFPQDVDWYDIRQPASSPFPPSTYLNYLQDPKVIKAIGAKSKYSECSDDVAAQFSLAGDSSRSYLPTLSDLVSSGLPTLLWAGDADAVCDWFGGYACVNSISYRHSSTFKNKALTNYTVNGAVGGTFKTVGDLSWIRVFDSGHMVPAFQPELAFQVFKQLMSKGTVWAT